MSRLREPCDRREGFGPAAYVVFAALTGLTLLLCVCAGSVAIPPGETLTLLAGALHM